MVKRYKYLQLLPHSDSSIAVPISGLFTELSDRKIALSRSSIVTPESKLLLKTRHKDANRRIGTCLGYLSTISYRLTDSKDNLFMNLHLDWENLIIYSQIMLDSFSVLAPIFYGVTEKYTNSKGGWSVNGFNNLEDWFSFHQINDILTRRFKLIKKKSGWYKKLNVDRVDFVHGLKTPHVISKKAMKGTGFKIRKDKIFTMRNVRENWVKLKTIEKEAKIILQNLLDFLVYSDFFFREKLKEQKFFISDDTQFKSFLLGNFRKFNRLIFKS